MHALRRALARHALALWFAAIALFGLARFIGRLHRLHTHQPDAVAWLWLAGACIVGGMAIAAFLASRRRRS